MNARGFACILVLTAATLFAATRSAACPFCNAVNPTFAERRESATVCALAEVTEAVDALARLTIHRIHQGEGKLAVGDVVEIKNDAALQPGDLAVLLGSAEMDNAPLAEWRCSAVRVDPASYLYFAKAPDMRVPAAERLAYFLPHLDDEHAEVASDAFAELGRAPLDAVEALADTEVAPKLRAWLADEHLPNERRGGYGLMLGLSKDAESRRANAALLRALIDKEQEDFRAGFDGVLAGYLLLEPEEALRLIDEKYVANTDARPGDTRHALAALRFCVEYARGPERAQLLNVMRHALARPAFAADVVKDLARWKDWTATDDVAALYTSAADDPALRRAVVGYLKACPLQAAATQLDRLRAGDPDGVKAIERRLALPLQR